MAAPKSHDERLRGVEDLRTLIRELHAKDRLLSQSLAQAMSWASKWDRQLADFCSTELNGYADTVREGLPQYRQRTFYSSPRGDLNPYYVGQCGTSNVLMEIQRDKKNFKPVVVAFRQAVPTFEAWKDGKVGKESGPLVLSIPAGELVSGFEPADVMVSCYGDPKTFDSILSDIALELSRRLTRRLGETGG